MIKVFEAKTLGKWIDDQELLLVLVISISRATQCSCMMMAGYKHPAHRLTPKKTSQGKRGSSTFSTVTREVLAVTILTYWIHCSYMINEISSPDINCDLPCKRERGIRVRRDWEAIKYEGDN